MMNAEGKVKRRYYSSICGNWDNTTNGRIWIDCPFLVNPVGIVVQCSKYKNKDGSDKKLRIANNDYGDAVRCRVCVNDVID